MIVNQNQNITHLINERGDGESHTFNKAKSPSLNSDNSDDVGSADSGRASSGEHYSPRHDSYSELSTFPMYEFEIPHSLVGLIIGIKGKTIKVCTVEGKREYINKCLRMLRHRFPIERFPELNLQPILPAPLPSNPTGSAAPSMLVLPFNIRCEIFITSIIDLGHVFVNQNSHPSFTSLPLLDNYMRTLYSKSTGIPEVPKPMAPGILCAAPSHSGFVRAITCIVFEEEDEAIVRYVDHGGYARLPRADLKQIRTDFMALPFQSSECYLAHVSPVDGTTTWCSAANQLFNQYCMNKVIEGKVIGYNARDELPVVEFYVVDDKGKEIRFDELLLSKNYAKVSDPSSTRCEPKRNEKYSSEVQVFTP
uniref:Tudor domain-containing protein n=1 Tax=Rhabditophanes sp. KR3021 TaxID=114890 RepID=A0AC35TQU5_9BILA